MCWLRSVMMELEWRKGTCHASSNDFIEQKKGAVLISRVQGWDLQFVNISLKRMAKLFMYAALSMWEQQWVLHWRRKKNERSLAQLRPVPFHSQTQNHLIFVIASKK